MYYKRRTGPRLIAGAIGGGLVLLAAVGAWNALRPLPAAAVSQQSFKISSSKASLWWPSLGSAAVEVPNVGPLLTSGATGQYSSPVAAKVIAALTILQEKPLEPKDWGPVMVFTGDDLNLFNRYMLSGAPVLRVSPGEVLHEYEGLRAMMLSAGDNITDSVAIWAFGSLANYKAAATQYVQSIGLSGTVIGNDASGYDHGTKTTAADMVRLGQQALADPVLADIVKQTDITVTTEGAVHNANPLLGKNGVIGLKGGAAKDGSLLFAAQIELIPGKPVTVIGAIVGQPNQAAAAAAALPMLASIKDNLYVATPLHANQTVATFKSAWGTEAPAVAKKDVSIVAWKGNDVSPHVTIQKTAVSYDQGATVGNVVIENGTQSATSDIVLNKTLSGPNLLWRLLRL